ncbi:MAG: NAD(P)/FAD-dependent oxidoreductase [Halobacteriovoraceae bacterium]|nr:NAD(P)/FAD-dependent oxidoreductase [Halobacteriovoraceae bacterium]
MAHDDSYIYPIAIIGGGSAGTMAVLRTVLNNDETLFFPGTSRDRKRSREKWVAKVENMPGHLGYEKGIEEPNKESLIWLSDGVFKKKFHWLKNIGAKSIRKENDIFVIEASNHKTYRARFVILCTGVMDVQPEISGAIKDILPYANKQTADYCIRCDGHHVQHKKLAIIGHSNSAAWVGIILQERYDLESLTILTNGKEPEFSEEARKLLSLYSVKIHRELISKVNGEPKNGALKSFELKSQEVVVADICFISLGMIVYNELAKQLGAKLDERGFVLADEFGESSISQLYVAGDLRANKKKQIYTAWDTAVDSADRINSLLRTAKRNALLEGI